MARAPDTRVEPGVIKDLGLLAIKSIITLNSGAFIVILTFLGIADMASAAYTVSIARLKLALACFLVGIAATALAIAIAYISAQLAAAGGSPFRRNRAVFLFWMVAPLTFAMLAFLVGVSVAITAIEAT
jgi:hypothetical protein